MSEHEDQGAGADEIEVVDDFPGCPRWLWRVEGTAQASGTIIRGFEDSGVVQAEGAGDALNWLVHRGPFWDGLNADEEFTVTISPDVSEEAGG